MVPPFRTQDEFVAAAFDTLTVYNIVHAVASGSLDETRRWWTRDSIRIIPGIHVSDDHPLPALEVLQRAVEAGEIRVLGELGLQYLGLSHAWGQLAARGNH